MSSNSVLVDIMVSPEDKAKEVDFNPDRIRLSVRGKSLELVKSKVQCGYPDMCYHASVFLMPDLADFGVSPDSVWCVLDLDGVLNYQGRSLDIGRLEGRLPGDWR